MNSSIGVPMTVTTMSERPTISTWSLNSSRPVWSSFRSSSSAPRSRNGMVPLLTWAIFSVSISWMPTRQPTSANERASGRPTCPQPPTMTQSSRPFSWLSMAGINSPPNINVTNVFRLAVEELAVERERLVLVRHRAHDQGLYVPAGHVVEHLLPVGRVDRLDRRLAGAALPEGGLA